MGADAAGSTLARFATARVASDPSPVTDEDIAEAKRRSQVAMIDAEAAIAQAVEALADEVRHTGSDEGEINRLKTRAEALDYAAIALGRRLGPHGGRVWNLTNYEYRAGQLGSGTRQPAGFTAER